jgi:hypothetical protein
MKLFSLRPFHESQVTLFLLRFIVVLLVWDTHSGWIAHWDQPLAAIVDMARNPLSWDMVYTTQPAPNGLASLGLDLTWLARDGFEKTLRFLALGSLLLYLARVPTWLSLAVPTWFGILSGTLSNSQGHIGHITQMLHVTLLCLWVADVWRVLTRNKMDSLDAQRLQAHVGRQAIAAGYVVSALTKLYDTGGAWISNARYAPLQMVKNNDMKFFQDLDPAFQKLNSLAQLMMDHPMLSQLLFGLGLPLELFALLGCRNKMLAWMIGIALILFHVGVLQLMSLFFPFNIGLLLAFFVLPGVMRSAKAESVGQ